MDYLRDGASQRRRDHSQRPECRQDAGSDCVDGNHWAYPGTYPYGLAAVQAKELTRESIYQAIQKPTNLLRFPATGLCWIFQLNGQPMGSILSAAGTKKRAMTVLWMPGSVSMPLKFSKTANCLSKYNSFEDRLNKKADRYKVAMHWGWNVQSR